MCFFSQWNAFHRQEKRKSNIQSPGPTKAWHICKLITGLAFTIYFFYFAARWLGSRKSGSHTRVLPATVLPCGLMHLLLCCQVIRPGPCKSRCGRNVVLHEQKTDPEVFKVDGRRRLRKLKNPPSARWYSEPWCDRGHLRGVQIKENATVWNVVIKKAFATASIQLDVIAKREPRRIAPLKTSTGFITAEVCRFGCAMWLIQSAGMMHLFTGGADWGRFSKSLAQQAAFFLIYLFICLAFLFWSFMNNKHLKVQLKKRESTISSSNC